MVGYKGVYIEWARSRAEPRPRMLPVVQVKHAITENALSVILLCKAGEKFAKNRLFLPFPRCQEGPNFEKKNLYGSGIAPSFNFNHQYYYYYYYYQ